MASNKHKATSRQTKGLFLIFLGLLLFFPQLFSFFFFKVIVALVLIWNGVSLLLSENEQ